MEKRISSISTVKTLKVEEICDGLKIFGGGYE